MGVTFTPNIGLAKPDDSELAEKWVNTPQLQDDNNQILITKTNIPLVAYTPTIIGQVTPPSLGAGSIAGEYQDILGFVQGNFIVKFVDPGVAVGSGQYGFSLPFVVDPVYHTVGAALTDVSGIPSLVGEGYIWDNSSVDNSGSVAIDVVTIAGVSYARLVLEAFTGKTRHVFNSTMPFSVATLDNFTCNFAYKRT